MTFARGSSELKIFLKKLKKDLPLASFRVKDLVCREISLFNIGFPGQRTSLLRCRLCSLNAATYPNPHAPVLESGAYYKFVFPFLIRGEAS